MKNDDGNIFHDFAASANLNEGGNLQDLFSGALPMLLSTASINPETIQQIAGNLLNQYKPVAYSIIGELFTLYEDLANNRRLHGAHADMKWNAYSAYIDAGFSPEQAMALLLESQGAREKLFRQISSMAETAQSALSR